MNPRGKWANRVWLVLIALWTVTTLLTLTRDVHDHFANQRAVQFCKDHGGTLVHGYTGPACFVGKKAGDLP